MAVAAEGEGSLLNSATWAIALTCFMFIAISIFFEKAIELAEHLLIKYKQISLQAAFHRIKDELMLVGFISIALTVGQSSVAKLCVLTSATLAMPLCKIDENATATTSECSEGHTPFIPTAGFHKLHIFIFILALVHILYSLLIVALGMWSVSFWNAWERLAVLNKEDSSIGGDIRLAKDTTFVRSRLPIPTGWMRKPIIPYVVAFFRQFFHPISETDYITLRNGFIMSHTPGHLSFNFHEYIRRSLQDDFQHVVGISPALWLFACIWLLVNVEGWETRLWTAFIALLFSFSGENCVNQEKYKLIVRLIVGFATQVILGLVTLPSYAIVSQMGTKLKRSMFEKNIQAAIIQWHKRAKENIHHESDGFLRDRHQNQDPAQSYSPLVSHVEMTSRV